MPVPYSSHHCRDLYSKVHPASAPPQSLASLTYFLGFSVDSASMNITGIHWQLLHMQTGNAG